MLLLLLRAERAVSDQLDGLDPVAHRHLGPGLTELCRDLGKAIETEREAFRAYDEAAEARSFYIRRLSA